MRPGGSRLLEPAATLKAYVLAAVFPVGSIYTNASDSTNPATLFGFGTWVAFGAGRVMVGVGTSDKAFTAGDTGGESNHTLTATEMPSHTHAISSTSAITANGTAHNGVGASSSVLSGSAGGDGAHNNLQPYIVVYLWQRTA